MNRFHILREMPAKKAPVLKGDFNAFLNPDPQIKFYHAKNRHIDRCGLLFWDPQAMFIGAKVHFHNKKYFVCKKGLCCDKLGFPIWRMAAPIIKYDCDYPNIALGDVYVQDHEILIWKFGEDTYKKLRELNIVKPLAFHDFRIYCENETYQVVHLEGSPGRGGEIIVPFAASLSSAWQGSDEKRAQVLEKALPMWNKMKEKGLGLDLSEEEIAQLLAKEDNNG